MSTQGRGTEVASAQVDADLTLLRSTVDRLREERDGLREALRRRAVIEQAKGVLMQRLGLGPDDAFAHLRRAARDGNRKLVDVAAEELARLGVGEVHLDDALGSPTSPDTPDGLARPVRGDGRDDAPTSSRGRPRVQVTRPQAPATRADRGLVLLEAALREATTLTEAAEALGAACRWPAPADRVTVLAVSADISLELVAYVGIDPHTASRWHHIPMTVDFPATVCARTGQALFEVDPDEAERRWPVLRGRRDALGVFCDLPLFVDGSVVGVVGLGWPEGTRLDGHHRRMLRAAAVTAAPHLLRLLPPGGVHSLLGGTTTGELDRVAVAVALDAVPAEAVLLLPVARGAACPDEDPGAPEGDVVLRPADLLLAWGNRALRARPRAGEVLGRRVGEAAPGVLGTPLWTVCLDSVGRPGPTRVVPADAWFLGDDGEAGPVEVSVTPMWNGVLVSRPAGQARPARQA